MPFLRFVALLACLGVVTSVAQADTLQTISNKNVKGKLVALNDKEARIVDQNGEEVKTPLAQVVAIDLNPAGPVPAGAKFSIVQLFESRLYCDKLSFKGNEAEVILLSGQALTIPLAHIISYIHQGDDPKVRDQWEKLLTKTSKHDHVLKLSDKGVLDALDGSLGDIDKEGKTIQFESAKAPGKTLQVGLGKITGLMFNRKVPPNAPVCVVHDTMGNKIAASTITMEGDNFKITTTSGTKLTLAEKTLSKLDFNQGKLVFLSDLNPTDVVEESGIGLKIGMKYRKDTNLEGEPILLGKADFVKGLTLHAHTELEFNLGGNYKDFKAVLGVDARAKTESKAKVIIECDGVKAFDKLVDPQKQLEVNVNVRNVQKMRIIVTSDDVLQLHDQATLGDARITQ